MKKYILFIDSLGSGGAQRQIVSLAIYLKKNNIPVEIAVYHEINIYREELEKHNIFPIILKGNFILRMFHLIKLIHVSKPQFLIAFLFTPSLISLLTSFFFPKLTLIIGERSFEENTPRLHSLITRKLYFRANYVLANSKSQQKVLLSKYPGKDIQFIPNGITINGNYSIPLQKVQQPIISIGRVSPLKNVHTLIEAIAILKRSNVICNVIWLGDYIEYSEYYEKCDLLLQKYNIVDQWQWKGVVSNVSEMIHRCSFLYHGSFGEGFPNAIVEALSCKTPVIASDVYDHSEIISNDYNGFLFDPNSTIELKNILNNLMNISSHKYKEMSENSFKTALMHFSDEKVFKHYLNF
jgi:glycosyltransferase involved in cell wall biosynthesis